MPYPGGWLLLGFYQKDTCCQVSKKAKPLNSSWVVLALLSYPLPQTMRWTLVISQLQNATLAAKKLLSAGCELQPLHLIQTKHLSLATKH
jgi:hypothetical protein